MPPVQAAQTTPEEQMSVTSAIFRVALRNVWRALWLAAGISGAACAQPFPSQVIHIILPPGPGTPPDVISRIVARELVEAEGWSVVVENRTGGLQTIAMGEVAKRPADGYALLAMSVPMMAAPSLLPTMGLRPEIDFVPVVKISTSYAVLV